jgi:WD40 repeat protein
MPQGLTTKLVGSRAQSWGDVVAGSNGIFDSCTFSGSVLGVRLFPNGRVAVTCSDDMSAHVWSIVDAMCVHVLQGHTGWTVDTAVSMDGRRIVTASHDGTARWVAVALHPLCPLHLRTHG